MNYLDLIIIIVLIFGFLVGFKRGFTKQLVISVGTILIYILSFILKNPVATLLYNNLPFFNFAGLTAFNILLYEGIALILIFFILSIVLRLLIKLTSIFEKILKMTIILGIPSKILGGILGLIQNLIYVFIILFILNLPMFSSIDIKDSKLSSIILNNMPIISKKLDNTFKVTKEIDEIKDNYSDNKDEYNKEIVNLLVEKNIITKKNVEKLDKRGKISK